MASTPWISFGNRLFKRGNAFFIRVRIPRDLQDLYAATGRRSEICETLKTRDRREAERRCRRRGAEIDQEFAQRRKARDAASQEPTSRRLDLIAQRLYREEVTDQGVAFHDQMMRDPDEAEEALGIAVEPWIEGLEEEAWSRKQNEIVAAVLVAAGSPLGPDHPEFPEARDKIARAFVWANRTLASHARGERSFTPPDPLFSTPGPPTARNGLGRADGGYATLGITVGDLIARYEADRGRAWSGKTRAGYVLIFRALREFLGEHTPVASIDREDCRRVRQALEDLAPNYTQLPATRGRGMEEAARISRELDLPRRKPESVNSSINNLAALMNYAENEDLIPKSPARGLRLAITTRKKDRRNPFSVEQLGRIFGPASPLYRSGTPLEDRSGRFWVPLLSLWSGMRLNECCQLVINDVRYMREVPVIVIAEDTQVGGDEADAKRVKTEAGERFVPVHPELERLGFLRHWQAMQRAGRSRLFPDLRPGATGYYSEPFSLWFGRYLKGPAVAAYTRKTTFHSLRHNYRDALRDTEMSGEMVRALGGWAGGGSTSDDYGSGFTPERLYGAIKAVRYDGLDLSHLY
jgi:integrase